MMEGSQSALKYSCDELVASTRLLNDSILGTQTSDDIQSTMLRITRSLWWITQIVGKATAGDAVSIEFEQDTLESPAALGNLVIGHAKETLRVLLQLNSTAALQQSVLRTAVAAVLALGMLGHTVVGQRALCKLVDRSSAFEWLSACSRFAYAVCKWLCFVTRVPHNLNIYWSLIHRNLIIALR